MSSSQHYSPQLRALNTVLGALAAAQRWQLATELFAAEKTPGQGAYHALLSHLAWSMFVIVACFVHFGVLKFNFISLEVSFATSESQICEGWPPPGALETSTSWWRALSLFHAPCLTGVAASNIV